jgi:glucose-induced degradation protein 8
MIFCRDLNKLVMNYLVIEGYKEAAEKFQQETGADRKLTLTFVH